MSRPALSALLAAFAVLARIVPAAATDAPELAALQERLDVLTEEVRRLREGMALPDTDRQLEGWGGLGPAASKVYAKTSGLSLGGYGEFYFAAPTGTGDRTADLYRLITYLGYKFDSRVLMNVEIETEHATTGENLAGRAGEVSVEFAYLDFLLNPALNVRAGQLLLPIGLVNEMHEPPFYRGSFRPAVEQRIIPSTWRELGVGIHGEPASGFSYKLYAVSGLDAAGYGPAGIRDGRQKGNRALWEDVALAARVDAQGRGVTLGGSVFAGAADQGRAIFGDGVDAFTTVAEAHAILRRGGLEIRGLVASASIGDAAEVAAALSDVEIVTIPERQLGGYLEVSQETGRWLGVPVGQVLNVWARGEAMNLQHEVPVGLSTDPALETRTLTVGVEYLPHPSVVVKLDWTFEDSEGDAETADPIRLGAGFVF